jgi:crotonobetainyl-CoA:carnitine CoA-transferase CaiB-like acyl-CoA transferase
VRDRLVLHDELDARIGERTRTFDKLELMHALQARGVIAAAVLDGAEVLRDPQLAAREMFEAITLKGASRPYMSHRYIGARFDTFATRPLSRAPELGEHNRDVLQGLVGLSDAEYEALEASGVIATEPEFAMPVEQMRAALKFPSDEVVRVGTARRGS